MATVNQQRNSPDFQNYISAILALKKAGECLEPFTKDGLQRVHDTITQKLGQLPPCTKQCSEQIRSTNGWCNTCRQWRDQLKMFHRRQKNIKWDERLHSWLWPQDACQIAEVFVIMHTIQPSLKDISTVFSIWNNCTEFDEGFANRSQSLRDTRNRLFHEEIGISLDRKNKIIKAIRRLLAEPCIKISLDLNSYNQLQITLDELERQNVWFDQSLLFRSMEQLLQNQNSDNQQRKRMIEERLQKLEDGNKRNPTVFWSCILPLFFVLMGSWLYRSIDFSTTVNTPVTVPKYGCLPEDHHEAVLHSNVSLEVYIQGYQELTGRKWLYEEVELYIFRQDTLSHGVIVVAEMGYGKTAFMAHLVCANENEPGSLLRQNLAVYHVCVYQSRLSRNVGVFIHRFVSMISVHLSNFTKFLFTSKTCLEHYNNKGECESDMFGCFDQCVLFPIRKEVRSQGKPLIIGIDAIDECHDDTTNTNRILRLLDRRIDKLPSWIRFVITSRNISDIHSLRHSVTPLHLFSNDRRNIEDIHAFLSSNSVTYRKVPNPIWNFHFHKQTLLQNDVFPIRERSLTDYYDMNFERVFGTDYEVPRCILNVILTTYEPLQEEIILKIITTSNVISRKEAKIGLTKLYHFVNKFNGTLHLIHFSLKEWLQNSDNEYKIDVPKGHNDIATYYMHQLASNRQAIDIANLLFHISEALYPDNLVNMYKDLNKSVINDTGSLQDLPVYHKLAVMSHDPHLIELAYYYFKDVDMRDARGISASFKAAFHGNINILSALIKLRADLNYRVDFPNMIDMDDGIEMIKYLHWGYGFLDIAAQNGHVNIVKYLIREKNYNFTTENAAHQLPIHLACKFGHLEIVSILHNAFPWMLDVTCLYYAAQNGFQDIVAYCLDNNINDNCLPCNQSIYWLTANQVRMQGNFIQDTSEPVLYDDWRYINCETALHVAVVSNHTAVVRTLTEQHTNTMNCYDRSGKTPLMYAIIHNYEQIGSIIMKTDKYDPEDTCQPSQMFYDKVLLNERELKMINDNRCPLGYSLSALYEREWFTKRNEYRKAVFTEKKDEYGCHPLHYAACHGSVQLIQTYINRGSTNITSLACSNGSTLIHSAAICGSMDSVKFLQHFFSSDIVDKAGRTVLMYSVMRDLQESTATDAEILAVRTLDIVNLLMLNNHTILINDENNRNLFHYILVHGHFMVVSSLVERDPIEVKLLLTVKESVYGFDPISFAAQQMQSKNNFSLNAANPFSSHCKIDRPKYLMSPTEYSIYILLASHSSGTISLHFNNKRILIECIKKNSFQLFAAILRCIRPNLTSNYDERILKTLIKYDVSGIMMLTYIEMRWGPGINFEHFKCVPTSEFSVLHFLALYASDILRIYGFSFFPQPIYTPSVIIKLFSELIDDKVWYKCYDNDGYNLLERAVQGGNVMLVKMLLKRGFRSTRNICELLKMTITVGMFKTERSSPWTMKFTNRKEKEMTVITLPYHSTVEIMQVFLRHFQSYSSYDELGKILIDYFHISISKHCICSDGQLGLSLVHYFAIQNYKRSIETALKYFGQSILQCGNIHSLTPLYFANLFNSSDVILYLESKGLRLTQPDPYIEYNLIFAMQTNFFFNKSLYEICFPYRFGGPFNLSKFRRTMIMVKCWRKLVKLFEIKDERAIPFISETKSFQIFLSNYNTLKQILIRKMRLAKLPKTLTAETIFYMLFFHMETKIEGLELKYRWPKYLTQLVCRVFIEYAPTFTRFKWNTELRAVPLEEMCSDFFLYVTQKYLHDISFLSKFRKIVNEMKFMTLHACVNTSRISISNIYFLKRLTRVHHPYFSKPLLLHDYFNDIKYTSSYRNTFYLHVSSITRVSNHLAFLTGSTLKTSFEAYMYSKNQDDKK